MSGAGALGRVALAQEVAMSRAFNGQIRIRVSSSLHEEIAREALAAGTSISGICAQALIVRRALLNIDPWKFISEVRRANRDAGQSEVERVVAKAVKAVRKNRRH